MAAQPLDLLQGTVDILVLQTLAWGPMHGYAVASWVRERTGGVLELEDAPLYKALHRREKQGYVEAEWGLSENNRRARYYQLTAAGREQFERIGRVRNAFHASLIADLDEEERREFDRSIHKIAARLVQMGRARDLRAADSRRDRTDGGVEPS